MEDGTEEAAAAAAAEEDVAVDADLSSQSEDQLDEESRGYEDENDDDDEGLASFLESEILSGSEPDHELEPEPEPEQKDEGEGVSGKGPKRRQGSESDGEGDGGDGDGCHKRRKGKGAAVGAQIETGQFSRIPAELFLHIFKFLSSEDLISCALVCRFMNATASDETLWRRLYCMRWGLASNAKPRVCAWKKLYIQRDQDDMVEFVRNTPSEFKEYYIQMQAAKRSQAPLPSQVNDDRVILDRTIADQVSSWKSSRGLTDEAIEGHTCSGSTCSYTQIGDVFICEKTGRAHVCDDACREFVLDQSSGLLVCTISGHCFERWLCPDEEWDADYADQQQAGVTDEAEPFMGSGRFARAYLLGYNCADEKELEAALRFC